MTFKIEKGVPIPAKPGTRETIYPFAEMVPGDSFPVPILEGKTAIYAQQQIRARATTWAARNAAGAKFVTRAEPDGKSVRIWLLSKPQSLAPLAQVATPPPRRRGPRSQARRRRGRPTEASAQISTVRASDSIVHRRRETAQGRR